nr:hypothetical protein pPsy0479b_00024 [Pseudomonas syringae]
MGFFCGCVHQKLMLIRVRNNLVFYVYTHLLCPLQAQDGVLPYQAKEIRSRSLSSVKNFRVPFVTATPSAFFDNGDQTELRR